MKRTALALILLGGLAACGPRPEPSPTPPPPPAETTSPSPLATEAPQASPPASPASPGSPAGSPGAALPAGVTTFEKDAKTMPGYAEVAKLTVPAETSVDLAKGQELYKANCASCHGNEGKGDGPAGAALDPKPRDQTNPSAYKYGADPKGIFRTARYGDPGTGMVPFSVDQIPDKDLWNIVFYVKSLQKS
jgi:mono/diheme cytochrome c family protein